MLKARSTRQPNHASAPSRADLEHQKVAGADQDVEGLQAAVVRVPAHHPVVQLVLQGAGTRRGRARVSESEAAGERWVQLCASRAHPQPSRCLSPLHSGTSPLPAPGAASEQPLALPTSRTLPRPASQAHLGREGVGTRARGLDGALKVHLAAVGHLKHQLHGAAAGAARGRAGTGERCGGVGRGLQAPPAWRGVPAGAARAMQRNEAAGAPLPHARQAAGCTRCCAACTPRPAAPYRRMDAEGRQQAAAGGALTGPRRSRPRCCGTAAP